MSAAAYVTVGRTRMRMSEIAWGSGLAAALTTSFSLQNTFTGALDVSVFPDGFTLFVVPAVVCVAVWVRERAEPLQTVRTLKQYGWHVAMWAALLFAICAALVTRLRGSPAIGFVLIVFAMTFIATAIVGYTAADLGSRLLMRLRSR
jgi:hypothetical protein